jgi:hypothetical protein
MAGVWHGVCELTRHGMGMACELAFNPLNTQLNPICHLLALLEAHHILHVSTHHEGLLGGTEV